MPEGKQGDGVGSNPVARAIGMRGWGPGLEGSQEKKML